MDDDIFKLAREQLDKAAKLVGGNAWGADKGKPRIYMRSAKDRKIYFAFEDFPTGDDGNILGGAALKIHIDDCGQHANWYAGQRKKIMSNMQIPALALMALGADDEALAQAIMEDLDDGDDDMLDEASRHLLNGRTDEARAVLGLN